MGHLADAPKKRDETPLSQEFITGGEKSSPIRRGPVLTRSRALGATIAVVAIAAGLVGYFVGSETLVLGSPGHSAGNDYIDSVWVDVHHENSTGEYAVAYDDDCVYQICPIALHYTSSEATNSIWTTGQLEIVVPVPSNLLENSSQLQVQVKYVWSQPFGLGQSTTNQVLLGIDGPLIVGPIPIAYQPTGVAFNVTVTLVIR